LNNDLLKLEIITDFNFLAWKTKRLDFTEAGLDKVFKDLMLAYHISIEWPEEVAYKKLTARFENEKPETILSSIELLFDVTITEHNGTYKVNL
jgi:ferric-dicitrate binding protein FerR (iron transport regulator)